MYADSRKTHIIEAVLKAEDDEILSELEQVIERTGKSVKRRSTNYFVGIWKKADAEAIEKAIEEGCEQIHPDGWK